MSWTLRPYIPYDYKGVKALYLDSDTYGGHFDEARDAPERLAAVIAARPDAIWVAEQNGRIVGTISLVDDGRVAWLFRFAVANGPDSSAIAQDLYTKGCNVLRSHGHSEVLVYSPARHVTLDARYHDLGMTKGGAYTCYYAGLKK